MKYVVNFGLVAAASALSDSKIENVHQKPLLADACPSHSILHDGICQQSVFLDAASATPNISFSSNTQTLDEARASAQKTTDFPWTFWPECYSNENTTEPICVFSDQTFANGRGIFLVSTASQAYDILKKPAFTDPTALARINHHASPPFTQHDFPGKGRGLVANKTLHPGDQIFASTPLLITNPEAYLLTEEERLKLAHRGVASLPPSSQTLFWALLDHFKGDPVDDRINTNAFEIYIDSILQHAVLPEIAMLNHDCRPNAAYFWDEETLSHYVHATQTIHPGQEITITYINNEKSRARRMDNLKTNWGFDCSCSACSAHPAMTAESDARLAQMAALGKLLDDWTAESSATPEMAETLVSLYEQERLYASLGVPYKHAAEAYASFGERYQAMRFARLSVEYSVLDKGFRDRDVKDMRAMAKDPGMSWSWKKRVGMGRVARCGHVH